MKKVGDSNLYGMDESEEGEEEVEGTVIGGCGDEFIIMLVVYPHGTVSVSSLGYFLSILSSYKPSHPPLTLSIGERHI